MIESIKKGTFLTLVSNISITKKNRNIAIVNLL